MYIPEHFLQKDVETALDLISTEPFGMLVSFDDGAPMISHIPFVILEREPQLILAAGRLIGSALSLSLCSSP